MAFFALIWSLAEPLYAINDDVMIESVLSGSYLRPYPLAYYFSAELGFLLSGLYGLLPGLPWLGLFYAGCHVGCLTSLLCLTGKRIRERIPRIMACVFLMVVLTALCFQEFVLMHYTVLAALLGATGLVLFGAAKERKELWQPVCYFLLCYLVRENVFFMLLPVIAVAFLYLLIQNGIAKWKEYLIPAISFMAAFLLLFGINRGVLRGAEWKNYLEYNDVRTQVYDYLNVHTEEAALESYAAEGVTKEDVEVISSYDLALFSDGTGNLPALKTVMAYGEKSRESTKDRLIWAVKHYVHRSLMQMDDFPLNYLVLIVYLGLLAFYVWKKKFILLLPLAGLGCYRSAFWIFLLFRGRYPDRVILSLYLLEFGLLAAMAFREILQNEAEGKEQTDKEEAGKEQAMGKAYGNWIVFAVVTALFLGTALWNVKETRTLYRAQVNRNREDDCLTAYFEKHPDSFYFIDVYALVGRTKKVFAPTGNTKENYLWMGGWMTRHPLYLEKLRSLFDGAENAGSVLRDRKGVYLALKEGKGAAKEKLEAWLGARLVLTEEIEGTDCRFLIYEVEGPRQDKEN